MTKVNVSVYIATSLDGFIAREDGDIDWLNNSGHGDVIEGEDFGYKSFMSTIDALVMGRNTFVKVLSFGGKWPYGNKPVIVLTGRNLKVPNELLQSVSTLDGSPEEIIETLYGQGYDHIYLDGGETIQRFLTAGLVDKLTITQIPVLIGSGKPLFGSLSKDIPLRLLHSKSFPNGFVQNTYEVIKQAQQYS